MAKKAKPIPKGFHSLTPYLVVNDPAKAIDFYKRAFGAKKKLVHYMPDGKVVMHAEVQIGDSILMLSGEWPEYGSLGPKPDQPKSYSIHIYVANVDAAFKKAVAAGATVTMPVADTFWGDRFGAVKDPFGHNWSLATHKADLTEKQVAKAAVAAFAAMGKGP